MTEEHKPLPVAGYTSQSGDRVAMVNQNKVLEEQVLRRIEELQRDALCNPRCLAIAFTKIQEAFMWMNMAVFRPERVKLPGDDEVIKMEHTGIKA